jgi:hypothetical protein
VSTVDSQQSNVVQASLSFSFFFSGENFSAIESELVNSAADVEDVDWVCLTDAIDSSPIDSEEDEDDALVSSNGAAAGVVAAAVTAAAVVVDAVDAAVTASAVSPIGTISVSFVIKSYLSTNLVKRLHRLVSFYKSQI